MSKKLEEMNKCKKCVHFQVCYQCGVAVGGLTYCGNFEDKEKFVKLPCKVGDTIYRPMTTKVDEEKVLQIVHNGLEWAMIITGSRYISLKDVGVMVFLTREEAQKKICKKDERFK